MSCELCGIDGNPGPCADCRERERVATSIQDSPAGTDEPEPAPVTPITNNGKGCSPATETTSVQPKPDRLKKKREKKTGADAVCLTDLGNGKRFSADHGKIVRYCFPLKTWFVWDGKRWCPDDTGRAMTLAGQSVMKLYAWAENLLAELKKDDSDEAKAQVDKIKKILDFAIKSQHVARLDGMLKLARSEPGIPILPNVLDVNPWLLNVDNGTLDLKTGKLRPHSQEDYLTRISRVAFDPEAKCQRWENFLAEIFDYSEMVIAFIKRLIGYWLTGCTTEHILPFLYGIGGNGKSVLIGILLDLLGPDYSGKASRDLLMKIKNDKHPTVQAWLRGKRFAAVTESAEGAQLDEALCKDLTGGDDVSGRGMFENASSFRATHKLAMSTNHRPIIKGTDGGIWRRIILIPFEVVFAESQQDKQLPEKLRAELPGILRWTVEGCLLWQKHGLACPPQVMQATKQYRSAEDRLGSFLSERCELHPGSTDYTTDKIELYQSFKQWCTTNGENHETATKFTQALEERGITLNGGRRRYFGITLIQEDAEPTAHLRTFI